MSLLWLATLIPMMNQVIPHEYRLTATFGRNKVSSIQGLLNNSFGNYFSGKG
jgi:hypothetical protein